MIAYITHGDELLVFDEPDFPEAGTQVPGGTLESQELPAAGVMREASEETGLQDLRLVRSLGTVPYAAAPGKEAVRHFFHLAAGTPWSPLKSGALSGKYTRANHGEARRDRAMFLDPYLNERTYSLVDELGVIVEDNVISLEVSLTPEELAPASTTAARP